MIESIEVTKEQAYQLIPKDQIILCFSKGVMQPVPKKAVEDAIFFVNKIFLLLKDEVRGDFRLQLVYTPERSVFVPTDPIEFFKVKESFMVH